MNALLWKSYSLRGLAAIVVGSVLAVRPDVVVSVGIVVFGAYLIALGVVDGGLMLFDRGSVPRSPLMVLLAVVDVGVGLLLVLHPQRTARFVLAVAGVFVVVQGLARLLAVVRERTGGFEMWVAGAAGACEVLLGIAFVVRPEIAGLGFVALIGAAMVAFGVVSLGAGLAMRAAAGSSGGPIGPA